MALNPAEFEWRLARIADAAELMSLYCESVGEIGHSPVVKKPTLASLQWLVGMCKRAGFPLWTLRKDGKLVAWAMIRAIAWGPEVCARTGDLSLYVAREWQGKGVPSLVVRNVYRGVRSYGFDNVTCWIFSTNRKSLMVARAARMERWGVLHRAADVGGIKQDVEIWGLNLDDPKWVSFMDQLEARQERRQRRLFGAAAPVPREAADAAA
jgi:L-amino acid N-acyltransferase YncA